MMDFEAAKALFTDSEANPNYVALAGSRVAFSKLANAVKNPFKLILLYGRPGTGKSYLLQRFYDQFGGELKIFFFKEPVFDPAHTLEEIYQHLCGEMLPEELSLNARLERFKEKANQAIYILLDEAQLYDEVTLEWIRVLSNQGLFKFIISVHKLESEDLLAKEHFKTRTFETIELLPISREETSQYIEKKLLTGNELELLSLFSRSNYRLIHRLSKGNLREINRLMSRILDILEVRFEQARGFFSAKLKNKYIEMAALDLKMNNG